MLRLRLKLLHLDLMIDSIFSCHKISINIKDCLLRDRFDGNAPSDHFVAVVHQ
jgi:hypothetical protein